MIGPLSFATERDNHHHVRTSPKALEGIPQAKLAICQQQQTFCTRASKAGFSYLSVQQDDYGTMLSNATAVTIPEFK